MRGSSRMEAPLLLTLILITGSLAAVQAAGGSSSSQQASNYDCDRGCPLTTYPVCGTDGEWYQNACMAHCAHVTEDTSADACGGAPMAFEDSKPGPHGAESGRPGGFARLIDKAVINAFKQEGLRYVGRIRLAKEMGPRPAKLGGPGRTPEPANDGNGNWKVATLRCTSDGDVYRGTITVPMATMDLKAFEPNRILGNWFKGKPTNKPKVVTEKGTEPEQLLQESGSYDNTNAAFSDDPSRLAARDAAQQLQQPQWQTTQQFPNPFALLWGKMREAADGLSSLIRPSSAAVDGSGAVGMEAAAVPSDSTSTAAGDMYAQGDNAALYAAAVELAAAAAAGSSSTVMFESARLQSAAAAYADGPSDSSSSAQSDAEEDDSALLSEVMGDVQEGGVVTQGYTVGNSTVGNRRLLEIINRDDRFLCDKGYPYTAIGQIQVVDNTGLYICTGVLIRPNKVLTAAHCVWNTKRNAFYYNLNFAPGRYRHDGKMVNPWGVVPWKSVTVFDAFKKDPSTWDVAVVTLSKNLGSVTGYMGMAAGCSSNTELTLAGYPQDQAQGTCMADVCRIPYLDCNALTNVHTCDTIMGMSGSPLWDSKNRIRMIHVAGIAGHPENRATTVTQFLVNTISKW